MEALLKSVIASPMVKYRGPLVLGQMPTDAWFKVAMIQKRPAARAGRRAGHRVPLPLTSVTQEWMTAARGLGLGEYDFAIVFDVLARLAGAQPSTKLLTFSAGASPELALELLQPAGPARHAPA